jgi:S1-C subfamily serine protease
MRLPSLLCGAFFAVVAGAAPTPARADDADVVEKVLPATVLLTAPGGANIGTGFLIDADARLVVTSHHVIAGRDKVEAFFPLRGSDGQILVEMSRYLRQRDRLAVPGHVVAEGARVDLALVELERVPEGVAPLRLAPAPPRRGEKIMAIGNSGAGNGLLWRYTCGEVRNLGPVSWRADGKTNYSARIIETTIPINKGDSGCALFNSRGEVVAVNHGYWTDQIVVQVGVDVRELRGVLEDYRKSVAQKAGAEGSPTRRPEPKPAEDIRMPR